jgi:DNA invertase Pin-like site-specific DNA recombinase
MNPKITPHHHSKPAYVYLRQSTPGQVRHHQQSTERQYALREKAQELGWSQAAIRILDGDLGLSGTEMTRREDFKTLVADVSMGQVGAVFALEASRLARSNLDWHRLLQLCALTQTLVIDEDGCYDPADFNDGLLLGLKGTMAQAELHFLRQRLQGGKLNKAQKGELRSPLAVGYYYDEQSRVIKDPDEEVRSAVDLVLALFRETGSACAVVRRFRERGLRFPTRIREGAWTGKIVWRELNHRRVLSILTNPCYAGAYVFARYQQRLEISTEGEVRKHVQVVDPAASKVCLREHHEGYITWDEYMKNRKCLEKNRARCDGMTLGGAPREGLALLQGLLLCGKCGRGLHVYYRSQHALAPLYQCTWLYREGMDGPCMRFRADLLDAAITEQALQALQPAELELAVAAVHELELRDQAIMRQWQMRLERAEYEAALAERRYQEVDPSNRLVAGTLERRWNDALLQLEDLKKQAAEFQRQEAHVVTAQQKEKILALARDLPRLWHAPSTQAKDRKRMLRLLIKDITIEISQPRQLVAHVRWQGGACTDVRVQLPPHRADSIRYPATVIDRVRHLAQRLLDLQIAEQLNQEGLVSPLGKPFTVAMIRWIRHRHEIPAAQLKRPEELTVAQVAALFGVHVNVVYYWIEHRLVQARRLTSGMPYWITITESDEQKLRAMCSSQRILPAS